MSFEVVNSASDGHWVIVKVRGRPRYEAQVGVVRLDEKLGGLHDSWSYHGLTAPVGIDLAIEVDDIDNERGVVLGDVEEDSIEKREDENDEDEQNKDFISHSDHGYSRVGVPTYLFGPII